MRKKLLALALALSALTALALPASAAGDGFEIKDGRLKRYYGPGGDVTVPSGVTSIGKSAFGYNQKITSVTLPDSVTEIENYAFENCMKLTSVTLPDHLTSIGNGAFVYCDNLSSIHIPDTVTSLGMMAFRGCKSLTSVNIPYGITSIEMQLFWQCSELKEILIPDTVTSIGNSAFQGCNALTHVTIPDGVTTIGAGAFSICKGLTSVSIPVSVTEIQNMAFSMCDSLTDVYYSGTEEQWNTLITFGLQNIEVKNARIHYSASGPADAEVPGETAVAVPSNDSLTADGRPQSPTVYKINGSNYFKIRDLAAILNGTDKQFSISYDSAAHAVAIYTKRGEGYQKLDTDLAGPPSGGEKQAVRSHDTMYINGIEFEVEAYKIDGSNYFKLRDLGKRINFYVSWEEGKGMFIESGRSYE